MDPSLILHRGGPLQVHSFVIGPGPREGDPSLAVGGVLVLVGLGGGELHDEGVDLSQSLSDAHCLCSLQHCQSSRLLFSTEADWDLGLSPLATRPTLTRLGNNINFRSPPSARVNISKRNSRKKICKGQILCTLLYSQSSLCREGGAGSGGGHNTSWYNIRHVPLLHHCKHVNSDQKTICFIICWNLSNSINYTGYCLNVHHNLSLSNPNEENLIFSSLSGFFC